jgi:hypothetical protein
MLSSNEIWDYDPSTTMWTPKADSPGTSIHFGSNFAFVVKSALYVGTFSEFWKYEPASEWIEEIPYPTECFAKVNARL